jgi:hypothetical protein
MGPGPLVLMVVSGASRTRFKKGPIPEGRVIVRGGPAMSRVALPAPELNPKVLEIVTGPWASRVPPLTSPSIRSSDPTTRTVSVSPMLLLKLSGLFTLRLLSTSLPGPGPLISHEVFPSTMTVPLLCSKVAGSLRR